MTSRLVLLLRVAAASAVGSLAGVVTVVVSRTIDRPFLVDGTAGAITLLWIVAVAIVAAEADAAPRTAPGQPGQPGQPGRGYPPPRPAPVAAALPPASVRPRVEPTRPRPEPMRVPTPAAGPSWYEAAAQGVAGHAEPAARAALPAPPPAQAAPPPPPPRSAPDHVELRLRPADESGRDVAQIVQCPRCGGFAVAGRRVRAGSSFACEECGHQWHLRPDQPWPVTVVRPQLRHNRSDDPSSIAPPVWRLDG